MSHRVPVVRPVPSSSLERAPAADRVVTVAELITCLCEKGYSAGVRAGLDFLCDLGGALLDRADDQGRSHGALCPAVVQLDDARGLRFVANDAPASARHAPPERLRGEPEDVGSDFFVAALMAVELMVGRPLYRGSEAQVGRRALRGDAQRTLMRWQGTLPAALIELLGAVLAPCPLARPDDYRPVVAQLRLLRSRLDVQGPPLHRVVEMVLETRTASALAGAPTVIFLRTAATVPTHIPTPADVSGPTLCAVPTRETLQTPAGPGQRTSKPRRFDLIDRARKRVRSVALPGHLTVAEAVAELARGPLAPPFTPTGQLRGWYTLHADGQRLSWDQRLSDLDRGVVQLDAELVPRHMVEAVVCLPEHLGGAELRTMVNAALPLRWALEPLVERVGVTWDDLTALTGGGVWVNGAVQPPMAPIGDGHSSTVRVDFHPGMGPRLAASA